MPVYCRELWYLCARVCVCVLASGRIGNTNEPYSRCRRVIVVVVRWSPTSNYIIIILVLLLFILHRYPVSATGLFGNTLGCGIHIRSASACILFEIVFITAYCVVYFLSRYTRQFIVRVFRLEPFKSIAI